MDMCPSPAARAARERLRQRSHWSGEAPVASRLPLQTGQSRRPAVGRLRAQEGAQEPCSSGSVVRKHPSIHAQSIVMSSRLLSLMGFALLLVLSGCGDQLACDSIDTRKAVLQAIADDHRNPLVNYAARESTAKPDPQDFQPQYLVKESSRLRRARTSEPCSAAAGFRYPSATSGRQKRWSSPRKNQPTENCPFRSHHFSFDFEAAARSPPI